MHFNLSARCSSLKHNGTMIFFGGAIQKKYIKYIVGILYELQINPIGYISLYGTGV
jgi:hypothetical protein